MPILPRTRVNGFGFTSMQPFFSTDGLHPRNRFESWRDVVVTHGLPMKLECLEERSFEAQIDVGDVGPLSLTRYSQNVVRGETTQEMIRRHGLDQNLVVALVLAGSLSTIQEDRAAICGPGSLLVLDSRPSVNESSFGCQALCLQLPRERVESVLGPARLYSSLEIGPELGATGLVNTFLQDLIRSRFQLTPDGAERMAAIGVDLIVASIAERLAHDLPQPLHGVLLVQRAKAYVDAHLHDHVLDPHHLAAAMGVSLRRLQELFQEGDQCISDYIWHRRLERAARLLNDPACAHMAIGMLAYGCGFVSQAHFSRRFKDRFGVTPREYRQVPA
ncbi:helix-turn-helix domain-containing protein [Methylobacterium sp. DCY52]|uniref:helix-turn-helix domain-containing protein n=2 Tax=unclassified Methylobacterium TaxID=2615210 RepID=UPI00314500AE